jgi:hypothetical protein
MMTQLERLRNRTRKLYKEKMEDRKKKALQWDIYTAKAITFHFSIM